MANKEFDEDLPSMVLDRDQVRDRKPSSRPQQTSTASPAAVVNAKTSAAVWVFLVIALLLAIAGGVVSSWLYQQSQLHQQTMVAAEKRIADLEGRLSATGENMNESAAALQVKVNDLSKKTKELWEQMDKLWASAWRRNQTDLADLTQKVDKQSATIDAQRDLVKSLEKTIQSDKTLQQSLGQQVKGLQSGMDQLKSTLLVYEATMSDQENQILEIKGVAVDTDEYRKNIEKRLSEQERWVDSFNASRKQVSEQLVDMEISLQKLSSDVSKMKETKPAVSTAVSKPAPVATETTVQDAADSMDIVIGSPKY